MLSQSNYIEGEYDASSLVLAVDAWNYLVEQKKLSVKSILETHRILAAQHFDIQPGKFRDCYVTVGGHIPPEPFMVPHLTENWVLDYGNAITRKDIKLAHIKFEGIHPFVDFNGRTGRLLLLWQTINANLPVQVIYESKKQEYYKWFQDA